MEAIIVIGLMIGTIVVWEIGKLVGRWEGRNEIQTMICKLSNIEKNQSRMWEDIKKMEREKKREWIDVKNNSRKELEKRFNVSSPSGT